LDRRKAGFNIALGSNETGPVVTWAFVMPMFGRAKKLQYSPGSDYSGNQQIQNIIKNSFQKQIPIRIITRSDFVWKRLTVSS
jgi:hypothetical protein